MKNHIAKSICIGLLICAPLFSGCSTLGYINSKPEKRFFWRCPELPANRENMDNSFCSRPPPGYQDIPTDKVYMGTRKDFELIAITVSATGALIGGDPNGLMLGFLPFFMVGSVLAAVDLPFSVVADTVLLPYTLSERKRSKAIEANNEKIIESICEEYALCSPKAKFFPKSRITIQSGPRPADFIQPNYKSNSSTSKNLNRNLPAHGDSMSIFPESISGS